ncbi:hypothetical protein FHS25_006293 [Rhizobium laguerreae]|uniref:Uncharacterized protein n=1 Tax=Rhizobium laguerreae TaxID=1076926 RepID=A0AAX2QDD8_9HYPH|nr:hypothetical protein [Rhizobium laguerreae]TCU15081.1 hypothetical protein EV131_12095 [Rhizobium laguerreae]
MLDVHVGAYDIATEIPPLRQKVVQLVDLKTMGPELPQW